MKGAARLTEEAAARQQGGHARQRKARPRQKPLAALLAAAGSAVPLQRKGAQEVWPSNRPAGERYTSSRVAHGR